MACAQAAGSQAGLSAMQVVQHTLEEERQAVATFLFTALEVSFPAVCGSATCTGSCEVC